MYKINELSSLFDVSTNTIRRYEDYGYISPSRDDENNYRHYSEEDIDKLVNVSKSRGFGFSHIDISDMTKASIYDLVDIYEKRNLEFDEEIKLLQEKKNRLKNDLKLLINCRDNVGRFIV
ncbi:MAG: MerR family transcriptional regulator, partial [Clostridia bacterium]|nr:MerR family transcriptional regulator [Clostridia bacterium]